METNDERVKREGEEADRAKLQYMVWCELVQYLDKASINFIRGHKPNGTAAWTVLAKIDQSTRRMARPLLRCFTEASLTFHLHVFGCQSFVLNEVRKKLDSKAREANLLGYSGNSKAYVVASTDGSETRAPKVWVSRNVNFNDDAFPYQRGSAVIQEESENDDASQSDVDDGNRC